MKKGQIYKFLNWQRSISDLHRQLYWTVREQVHLLLQANYQPPEVKL